MLIFLFTLILHQASATTEKLVGHAKQGGKDLYTEKVEIERDGGNVKTTKTEFFSPEGKRLAVMTSKASRSKYLPDIDFADDRDGYQYSVRHHDDKTLEIRVKESTKDPWETKSPFAIKKDMILIQSVIDFATDHLAEVQAGKKLSASFLVPSKATDFSMRISRKAGHAETVGKNTELLVESGNWLLRNTVFPAFTVTYDFEKKKIVKFQGISTIMAERGPIEIIYE